MTIEELLRAQAIAEFVKKNVNSVTDINIILNEMRKKLCAQCRGTQTDCGMICNCPWSFSGLCKSVTNHLRLCVDAGNDDFLRI